MKTLRPNALTRRLFRAPVYLYRWHGGWLLGHRFLLLAHVGRRTGLPRHTVLEVVEYRPQVGEAVVVSGFGRNAQWLRNIAATPHPEVIIGTQRFVATHRILGTEEAVRVFKAYEHRNRFVFPIIRGVLSRLLGWTYDGSDAARRRLVEQLPFVAFRPRA